MKAGEYFPDDRTGECGATQGSVLGPLLLMMYTYPLSSIITSFSIVNHHLYADKMQVCFSITLETAGHAVS